MAAVATWRRTPGRPWGPAQVLLPPGFRRGYDPSAATLTDGTIVVTSGVDLNLRPYCLDGGSVALTRISPAGVSVPVLVDDQRHASGFDDRPTVAAGAGTEVWAGWSHGTRAASCDLIGADDQIHVALSSDGGRTFGRTTTIGASGANFGVQIAPTGPQAADVAWAQVSASGTFRILLTRITDRTHVGPTITVGSGTALPAQLPGASFPAFSVPTMTLMAGRPALAWAAWLGGRGVIQLALPAPSGSGWVRRTITPAAGVDDLLPALGGARAGAAVLLTASHRRSADAVSYQVRRVGLDPAGRVIALGSPRTVLAGPDGPGYRELGESLQISDTAAASTTALVAGGARASRIWSLSWAR